MKDKSKERTNKRENYVRNKLREDEWGETDELLVDYPKAFLFVPSTKDS